MMESLYVELRQNYPGNQLHLMLVSPFIVETGDLQHGRTEHQIILHFAGMVKRSRIRFPGMMGTVDVPTAASKIVTNMRRRAAIVFIPDILYYISNIVRILPAKVQLLLTDFFDTGIDATED